tara:strand:- start:699 stop:1781 length:1083 start_codon:yes stop_codon:yes gene_type:complete
MAYSSISKSTDYFSVKTYAGNNGSQSITGVGHQPDWIWIKKRDGSADSSVMDSVRGVRKSLTTNNAEAEYTETAALSSFDSDGFSFDGSGFDHVNTSNNFVAWCWKAGTTSGISTDGETDITPSAYSFNATSGVSIVKYTGTGTSGEGVPHGLGAKPQFIMVKRTDTSGAWTVFTQEHLNTSNATKFFEMHNTDAESTNNNRWNGWQPDTVNFYLGNASEVNASGGTYVAYVFANKTGFSKHGRLISCGSDDGVFTYTGFAPKLVIIKPIISDGWSNWYMFDTARDSNLNDMPLYVNLSTQEGYYGGSPASNYAQIDVLSNGFKIRRDGSWGAGGSGAESIYMAFGQSIVGSNNTPATAN